MAHPKQRVTCDACEGYKRVATISEMPAMLDLLLRPREKTKLLACVGQPMPMIFSKAKAVLVAEVKGGGLPKRRDQRWHWIVKELISVLDTTRCPWCRGTGVSAIVQQVDPA